MSGIQRQLYSAYKFAVCLGASEAKLLCGFLECRLFFKSLLLQVLHALLESRLCVGPGGPALTLIAPADQEHDLALHGGLCKPRGEFREYAASDLLMEFGQLTGDHCLAVT